MAGSADSGADYNGGGAVLSLSQQRQVSLRIENATRKPGSCQGEKQMSEKTVFNRGSFFHGTRADLKMGDLIVAGKKKNYNDDRKSEYVYFAGTLDAAIWGAELAEGGGR